MPILTTEQTNILVNNILLSALGNHKDDLLEPLTEEEAKLCKDFMLGNLEGEYPIHHEDFLDNLVYSGSFSGASDVDIELMRQEGGGEGGAEDCETVIRFNEKYILFLYQYRSYEGFSTSFKASHKMPMPYTCGLTAMFVEPYQRIITDYR